MPRCFTLLAIAVLVAAGSAPAAAQIDIRTVHLSDRIRVLQPSEGSGNTIVFKGADGVLLIDTMADSIANHLHRRLDSLQSLDIRYIFNTHWHHNHLSGNSRFAARAAVFGAPATRGRLASPQPLRFLVQETFPRLPESAWPTVVFPDSISVYFNGEEIRAWHVKGHTDTDVLVYLTGSKILATGDLLAGGRLILSDLDTGGNMIGVASALAGALRRVAPDATVVPGHGAISKVADLETYVRGLQASIDFVRREAQAGRSLAEIQGQTPPAGALLGQNPARAIEAIYRSLGDQR